VSRHDIDDLVQETAARAIRYRVPYNDANDLRAWSFVVARRLLANLNRSQKRFVEFDANQRPDPRQDDMLTQVEDRLIIETVVESTGKLTVTERRHLALRATAGGPERNRANVGRHRARQRLRKLVGPFGVAVLLMRRRAMLAPTSVGAALVLPLLLLPSQGGSQSTAPASHRAIGHLPTSTTALAEPTKLPRKPETTPQSSGVSGASRKGPRPQPSGPALRISGPAGSSTHAAVESNDGKQPLVCTSGTIIERICVSLPAGIGVRQP
jgi:hypothetical protein